ncbi:lipocalin family protein [Cognatishimia sp. F0-27]|uniref:lipocalin family protein n=1 Tax=Cognatishimia sp. F0-27 TaxID=2816855 RepID=UPI001D0C1C79|nr:lipocalin family protein [Cognatishimia sp. F0-27]MCC1491898.1 lipocalin family protein [Cognatishimia sp. F0-27]
MRSLGALGLGVLGLVGLTACAAPELEPLPAAFSLPLRNPTAPIASQSDVTLARLQGAWIVTEGAGIPLGTVQFSRDHVVVEGVRLPVAMTTGGRLRFGDEDLWVHWLDINNRTAAIGAPSGGRVWIMDRTGQPGERRAAARKILAWYGYDLSRMTEG